MSDIPVYFVIITIFGSFGFCVGSTYLVKLYVKKTGLMDKPNSRSSHTELTPSGGGLSMVVTALFAAGILGVAFDTMSMLLPIIVTIILLAFTGWTDDRYGLSVGLRFIIYALVASFVIHHFGTFDRLESAGFKVNLGVWSLVFTLAWIVWLINLYNFMDGIDGLAAAQSAVAGCTFGIWFTLHKNYVMALFCYVIMAASLGFLVWNWSPARIFMGDVGSVTLGGLFALLALIGHTQHGIPIGASAVLLGLFICDTTVTLLRRGLAGEKIWEAHRSHFYQRAVGVGYTHGKVTAMATLIAVLLAVLATMEMLRISPQWLWSGMSLVILVIAGVHITNKESRRGS